MKKSIENFIEGMIYMYKEEFKYFLVFSFAISFGGYFILYMIAAYYKLKQIEGIDEYMIDQNNFWPEIISVEKYEAREKMRMIENKEAIKKRKEYLDKKYGEVNE